MSTSSRGPDPMVDDNKIITAVARCADHWDRPFATSTDVAERFDMSRQCAHRRLQQLHEAGEIEKYKPGRSVIWWSEGAPPQTQASDD